MLRLAICMALKGMLQSLATVGHGVLPVVEGIIIYNFLRHDNAPNTSLRCLAVYQTSKQGLMYMFSGLT